MEVKWLVEDYERDGSLESLINEIKLQGMQCEVVKYHPFESGTYDQYGDDECVVFFGSLNLARQLQREKGWVPGAYCNFKNFECSTYYSYWGKYLLNDDYIMMPLMEFYRKRKSIYNWYGHFDNVFMRPNSGAKTFNGAVFPLHDLDSEMELIHSYSGMPVDEIIVVISTPKVIDFEWRLVVADRKIVSASRYKKMGKVNISNDCEVGAMHFAGLIADEEWQPDRAYTLDICRSGDEYFLLEANSFSCSGLYDCSLAPIVRSVSKIALDEWREYQEV